MMDDVVVLEWTFTPPDFFEEVIHVERDSYTIVIDNGKVEARINPVAYDKEHKMRDQLHDELNDRFLGVQLLTHKSYYLSKASMYRFHADGRRDITVFPESIASVTSFGTVDFVLRDRNGNILRDSRRDRIEKKKELAELVVRYRKQDEFVDAMLKYYEAAIHDPKNELVHLFDIWEALEKRFGDEKTVKSTLSITNTERGTLGNLANNRRQGRHRGAKVTDVKDVTGEEIEEARRIAQKMIEAYLRYLDRQNKT